MTPAPGAPALTALLTPAAIRAEVDALAAKNHGLAAGEPRVVGLRGTPDPTLAQTFNHSVGGRTVTVRVAPCESALAVWEALADHDSGQWLIVVTDRPDDDLGPGVLARFIGQRVRLVDPWLGVRAAFGATGMDRSLTRLPRSRAVADGLLAVVTERHDGWPAAPAGLLTLDHVAAALSRRVLGLGPGAVDAVAVLRWTTGPNPLGALRSTGGDALADAVLAWLAGRTGAAAPVVAHLLREARQGELVPLGVAVELLHQMRTQDADAAQAWERLRIGAPEHLGRTGVADALGQAATTVVGDLLETDWERGTDLLARADRLLTDHGAAAVAARSPLLPSGVTDRLLALARELSSDGDPEAAWRELDGHALVHLARADRRPPAYQPALAAIRLRRWLGRPEAEPTALSACARRQVTEDAWVDSAIADAAGGVALGELSTAIADVVKAARERRAGHDGVFADALSRGTRSGDGAAGALAGDGDPVLGLERVVRELIVPLVTEHPAMLLVLDGMTARVAAEMMEDLQASGRGWTEALWPERAARAAAVAVLPTLTEHSRTSLLCGRITTGSQATERAEHPGLVHDLGGGNTRIFHKADLDTVADGHRVAHDVREAIVDTDRVRLVTCVLNTIDDALDRSDPGGTDWRLSSIKHLEALLEAAASVGRPVVITSDHGHVLERRAGRMALPAGATATSARSRTDEVPAAEGELLVRGPRVATGSAVLAVDELLRYTALKAGYHGGGAAAEVAVPVLLAWPGPVPEGYREAPVQRPPWWDDSEPREPVWVAPPVAPATPGEDERVDPPLFDFVPPEAPVRPERPETLGAHVVASATWQSQRAIAGRVSLTPEQCAALIDELARSGGRLPLSGVARALGIPDQRVTGAMSQAQKLLNVEGYAVLRLDTAGALLDTGLLREQFGLTGSGGS